MDLAALKKLAELGLPENWCEDRRGVRYWDVYEMAAYRTAARPQAVLSILAQLTEVERRERVLVRALRWIDNFTAERTGPTRQTGLVGYVRIGQETQAALREVGALRSKEV